MKLISETQDCSVYSMSSQILIHWITLCSPHRKSRTAQLPHNILSLLSSTPWYMAHSWQHAPSEPHTSSSGAVWGHQDTEPTLTVHRALSSPTLVTSKNKEPTTSLGNHSHAYPHVLGFLVIRGNSLYTLWTFPAVLSLGMSWSSTGPSLGPPMTQISAQL